MNIDFPRITPNLKFDTVEHLKATDSRKLPENAVEPLFSDALVIKEKENLSLGDITELDMDALEKELVRDDNLGKLISSQFNYEPPEMPVFV